MSTLGGWPPVVEATHKGAGMGTLVVVSHSRMKLNKSQPSEQTCYYVSNARPAGQAGAEELFDAIRGHRLVEVMHHQRDVTLAEDTLRSEIQPVSRAISSLQTLAVNLLSRLNPKNMAAQIDEFADRFQLLIQFMTQQLVL
jgi:hypothetical protein